MAKMQVGLQQLQVAAKDEEKRKALIGQLKRDMVPHAPTQGGGGEEDSRGVGGRNALQQVRQADRVGEERRSRAQRVVEHAG